MRGAQLQDVRDLSEHEVQEEEKVQRSRRPAAPETNAEIIGCGELFLVRKLPVRYLRD